MINGCVIIKLFMLITRLLLEDEVEDERDGFYMRFKLS